MDKQNSVPDHKQAPRRTRRGAFLEVALLFNLGNIKFESRTFYNIERESDVDK